MKLVEGFDSNYRYVLVAARRARQIQNGANPVVDSQSRKPCRIAEQEIQAGKVKWEIPAAKPAATMAADSEESPQGPVGGEADD
ncbi:MAG TPA: DNA-directed RNA polymerase subunit omega [Bryocella sp.]|nr:DNA-directed RNA polymerase subunit omega [Bryocella sp.]